MEEPRREGLSCAALALGGSFYGTRAVQTESQSSLMLPAITWETGRARGQSREWLRFQDPFVEENQVVIFQLMTWCLIKLLPGILKL